MKTGRCINTQKITVHGPGKFPVSLNTPAFYFPCMISIKYLFVSLLITGSLLSCAQGKYGIKKIRAFSAEQIPGNIPVDEKGQSMYKGPDTLYTIYIESTGKKIDWDSAWKNDRTYTVVTTLVAEKSLEAGTEKNTGKKIVLTPRNGNQLWMLQLVPAENKTRAPGSLKPGEIILRGRFDNKTIFQAVKGLTELNVFPSV